MKLHENKILFKTTVSAVANQKGLPDVYVEKDYWVTLALYTIFKSDIGSQSVFKGGTALSKCFDAIERFSEDIDIVVLRNDGETDSQLATKIKKIGRSIQTILPEKGHVGIMCITDKQFGIMEIFHGKKITTANAPVQQLEMF